MLTGSETPSVISGILAVPDSCDLKEIQQPKHDPSCAVIGHLGEPKLILTKLQRMCKKLYLQCGWTETGTWEHDREQSCWTVQVYPEGA